MTSRLGRIASAAGSVLAVGSIVFIVISLWGQREALSGFRPGILDGVVIALAVGAYALLGLVLAEAWRRLLIWVGEDQVRAADTRRIYAQTQLAKYIPGNVAQFAGRQFIGRKAGWTHLGLLLSTIFELTSLVAAGTTLAMMALVSGAYDGVGIDLWQSVFVALLAVAGVTLSLRILPGLIARRWPAAALRVAALRLRHAWPVWLLHLAFLLVCGLILVAIAGVAVRAPLPYGHWPAVVGLFAVAWIVSTLTPGAPSGIGVRELVLVTGLSLAISTESAILAAALLRLVTVTGDTLFFVMAGRGPRTAGISAPS